VESCLNIHNKHAVRKEGLALLLTFMEVLADQMEEQVRILCLPSRSVSPPTHSTLRYVNAGGVGRAGGPICFSDSIRTVPEARGGEKRSHEAGRAG